MQVLFVATRIPPRGHGAVSVGRAEAVLGTKEKGRGGRRRRKGGPVLAGAQVKWKTICHIIKLASTIFLFRGMLPCG